MGTYERPADWLRTGTAPNSQSPPTSSRGEGGGYGNAVDVPGVPFDKIRGWLPGQQSRSSETCKLLPSSGTFLVH